jgi:hypothetical protein
MSKIQLTACDVCGKQVENVANEPGWITIEASQNAFIRLGYFFHISDTDDKVHSSYEMRRDFCDIKCLGRYIYGHVVKKESDDAD